MGTLFSVATSICWNGYAASLLETERGAVQIESCVRRCNKSLSMVRIVEKKCVRIDR
jgi:hypothetical protein